MQDLWRKYLEKSNTLVKARITAWLLIIRSELRTIIFAWSLITSTLIASKLQVGAIYLITAFLGGYLLSLAIYTFNDLMDIGEDRMNSPNRPLASGSARREDAKHLIGLSLGIALGASLSINITTTVLFTAAFMLGISYSSPPFRAKKHFLGKIIVPVAGAMLASLTGVAIAGQISGAVILASIAFTLFSLVTLFLGDVADLKGDLSAGVRSLPVLIGAENTVKITLTLPLLIAVLGLSLYQAANLSTLFPWILTAATGYSSLTIARLLGRSEDVKCCRTVKSKMRIMHLVIQLCFIIGVIHL